MTSSPTTRNRLLKQGTGDNTNTWGDLQSSGDFDQIDAALDGVAQLTITGPVTLTTVNYAADQARNRGLKILAASTMGATITLPAVEKWYLVWNASAFSQVIASQGGGASVTLYPGEIVPVLTDAINVARLVLANASGQRLQNLADPTGAQDAATKAYADALAFTANAGILPGQTGNAGKVLGTNGTVAAWVAVTDQADYLADQAARQARAIAFAVAL